MGFHDLALARPLVVDAAEVQYAVDDDAVELVLVGLAKLLGVLRTVSSEMTMSPLMTSPSS